LNDLPPAESPECQIAALVAALDTARENEQIQHEEAARLSKECELMKWRFSATMSDFQQRERHLQAQISQLAMQVQALSVQQASPHYQAATHPHPPPHYAQALAMAYHPYPASPFIQSYPGYPHAHHSGLSALHSSLAPPNNDMSDVSEELAEAILKRPESIKSSVSRGRRQNGRRDGSDVRAPRHHGSMSNPSSSESSSASSPLKGSPMMGDGAAELPAFAMTVVKTASSPPSLQAVVAVDDIQESAQ